MERRFTAALASALVVHAAFVGVGTWCVATAPPQVVPSASAVEIDVLHLVPDPVTASRVTLDAAAASQARTDSSSPQAAAPRSTPSPPSTFVASGEVDVLAGEAPSESGASDAVGVGEEVSGGPNAAPRRGIDLGLDGAIVARALRDAPARSTARRPVLAFDGWSEGIVRSIAHTAAPSESSALLTVEWDAHGRLVSIRSSAESSHASTWRNLAESLKGQLARRPQKAAGALRLVYLVKSEVVQPGRRSKLPDSRHVSAEQLRDEHLPPAVSLNIGVKANTSAAGQRVVSVTLASSSVL